MLPKNSVQAIPEEIGTTNNPTTVTDNVTDVVVAPILTIVSTYSNIVFEVCFLFFIPLFWFMIFILEICYHFFDDIIWDIKPIYIIYFFSNRCSKSAFSNGALGYNSNVVVVIY